MKQKVPELEFDLRGNLKPYEVIEITIEEFEKNFVNRFKNSDTRKQLFINENTFKQKGEELTNFVTYQAKIVCNMDAYMVIEYPKKSKSYIFTKSNTLYWLNQFGRTRKSMTG
ncbi:MAG: hypothetical protein IIA88_07660, partial [Bacteroidetes bacterium]|nr:hypothetical protein [Bacteroidota bacterium]